MTKRIFASTFVFLIFFALHFFAILYPIPGLIAFLILFTLCSYGNYIQDKKIVDLDSVLESKDEINNMIDKLLNIRDDLK